MFSLKSPFFCGCYSLRREVYGAPSQKSCVVSRQPLILSTPFFASDFIPSAIGVEQPLHASLPSPPHSLSPLSPRRTRYSERRLTACLPACLLASHPPTHSIPFAIEVETAALTKSLPAFPAVFFLRAVHVKNRLPACLIFCVPLPKNASWQKLTDRSIDRARGATCLSGAVLRAYFSQVGRVRHRRVLVIFFRETVDLRHRRLIRRGTGRRTDGMD